MNQQLDSDKNDCGQVSFSILKSCCCDYYTKRQQVLRYKHPLASTGFYVSISALCTNFIGFIGCLVFVIVVTNGHELWAEEKPMIVPLLRKANEWIFFSNLKSLTSSTIVDTFDCTDSERSFVVPAAYESTRFNTVLCDANAESTVPTFNASSWTCFDNLTSTTKISAAIEDSGGYLEFPSAVITYATKSRVAVPQCSSSEDLLSAVSFVRDVELAAVELGFFVSDMHRFEMQSEFMTNAEMIQRTNEFTARGGEFESVKLVSTSGETVSGCVNTQTGVLESCEWRWASGEDPSRIVVTVGNLLSAAGLSSLQDSNEAFKSYYDTRGQWPSSESSLAYPYQLTGLELAIVVRWNNAPVCDGAEFLVGRDQSQCTSSTMGARPMVAEISVDYNPTFRPLRTSASADGSFEEQYGIRITMAGGGYIVDDVYDLWLLYVPLITSILVASLLSCCMETFLFMRCKQGLPRKMSLLQKICFCPSRVCIWCGGYDLPCESLSKMCKRIWHTKPRIAHIRKKFYLQRNYHKAQDDILDEDQVLLHRVTFKPQSNNQGAAKISDITRQKIVGLLSSIQTDRSQLDRLVRKEKEMSLNPSYAFVNSRLAALKLLLTSGVSANEIEMKIEHAPTKKDQHCNLLRAIFLEFADVLAEYIYRHELAIRPPSRELSFENLRGSALLDGDDDNDDDEISLGSSTKEWDSESVASSVDSSVAGSKDSKFDLTTSGEESDGGDVASMKRPDTSRNMDRMYEFCMDLQNAGYDFSSDDDDEDGENEDAFEGI